MRRSVRLAWVVFTGLTLLPSAAYAQASIAGVVKDTSGAVLPGVTVEAGSPALIEKIRAVVTDGTGQYKIENLRPGTYTVTFTLAGFNTVKREGIELTGTFTASVNADLRVGALEETITVTGETPVVDVQNTTRQQVMNQDLISALPSGRNAATMAALLPGVNIGNQDVGGINGESGSAAGSLTVHGNTDVRTEVNGISVHSAQGSGSTGVGNIAAYQEMAVDTAGVSAEQKEGGVRMNLIPREGGNTFRGSFYGAFANGSMQADNFTQDLKNRGLGTPNSLKTYYDVNPEIGGPIKRDLLWFHGTVRRNEASAYVPQFYNLNAGNPNVWTFAPGSPATNDGIFTGLNGRVTWQASTKNKIGVAYDYQNGCQCPRGLSATIAPESNIRNHAFLKPKDMTFVDWSAPLTNRLLLEAGTLYHREHAYRASKNIYFTNDPGGVRLNAVVEQSTNLTYRGAAGDSTDTWNKTFLPKMSLSYITGSHAFKVGFNIGFNLQDQYVYNIDSPMFFRFNNGVPNQLTMLATPYQRNSRTADHGAYVQDRWTVNRLTITAGLRYDYFHAWFPSVTAGSGEFVPNRRLVLPETQGVRLHDLEPRSGLVYDLFGNGKTALKVSLNKYLPFMALPNSGGDGGTFTTNMAPVALLVTSTTRSWNDANRNYLPDCDLTNPLTNGECGAMSNPDFGSTRPGVSYDPDIVKGWNKRQYNWQLSAGVQRELLPRVSLDVSYFRTWFGNFFVTDNRGWNASDFDRFSITSPVDPMLPGGGAYEVSGLYNIKPEKFSVPTDNYVTFADKFGKQIQHWNGVDLVVNARPRAGWTLGGGISSGRTTWDNCDVVAKLPELLVSFTTAGDTGGGTNPNANVLLPASYCHQQSTFLTQVKLLGTYTLPRVDVQFTATLQSMPGPQILANYIATNAVVAPRLGRNLSGNAANVTVTIVNPGTMYGERMNQLDLRLGKILRIAGMKTSASIDIYNALNASPVLTLSNAFAAWQRPQSILNARFAKVVVQFDF